MKLSIVVMLATSVLALSGRAFAQSSDPELLRQRREYHEGLGDPPAPPPPVVAHANEAMYTGGVAAIIVGGVSVAMGGFGTPFAFKDDSRSGKLVWPTVLAAGAGVLGAGIALVVIGGKPAPAAGPRAPQVVVGAGCASLRFSF